MDVDQDVDQRTLTCESTATVPPRTTQTSPANGMHTAST